MRYHATSEGNIPFTAEEEAEWDALDQKAALIKIAEAKVAYQSQRAAEYPPVGDQLDALWKGGDAAAQMLAQVQAVKTKYPKP
jgi:hypothetical protein